MTGSGRVADAFREVLATLLAPKPSERERRVALTHDASGGTLGVLEGEGGVVVIATGYVDLSSADPRPVVASVTLSEDQAADLRAFLAAGLIPRGAVACP